MIPMTYSAYDHDKLEEAAVMRIERTIYFENTNADISSLTALTEEQLKTMREESAAAEQTIFHDLQKQAAAWEEQAGRTLLIDKAIEYARTPAVRHTANKWEQADEYRREISNMVYRMSYRINENTRYDKTAQKSVPYSWSLSWSVRTNSPSGYNQAKIAGQDRKVFDNKDAMQKYLYGRMKAYSHLFSEISPPVPKKYAEYFKVNGQLLPGYILEGETLNLTEQEAAPAYSNQAEPPIQKAAAAAPLILTSEKPTDKLTEITDRLEKGVTELFESDRYKEYLNVMSKFHNYSFNNTVLIAMQKPDASLIAGFNSWKNQFERSVKKGEKGIRIIAPSPYKVKKEIEKIDPKTQKPVIGKDGKPVTEEKEITIPSFKVVSVFDVSQTEGKELPAIAAEELTGDVKRYGDFYTAIEKTSPVPIVFEKIEDGAHGYYDQKEKRIAISEGMSELQTLKTAVHEIAHAKLHDIDLNAPEQVNRPDRRTREVQAESIAYAVCQHYGLDTSDYSFGYVAGWSSGKEAAELKSSLETIRGTAAEIIDSIDANITELQKTHTAEQEAKTEIHAFTEQKSSEAATDKDAFSIYQLKHSDETRDLYFEPYDRLKAAGYTVDPSNYELVYSASLSSGISLEDIFIRFNTDHPEDFKGHSLSVSDIVVLERNGQDTAHYVDSFGYRQVPEFLQEQQKEQLPDDYLTGEKIKTPRGTFSLTDRNIEQMKEAGYGFHHQSDDGKYLIMANGTQAFAIPAEQKDRSFDSIIGGPPSSVEELEAKAKEGEQISLTELAAAVKSDRNSGRGKEDKPSIRAQLKESSEKALNKKAAAKNKNNDLEV